MSEAGTTRPATETAPIVTAEATPVAALETTPVATTDMAPVPATETAPIVTAEATPVAAPETAPVVAPESHSAAAKSEEKEVTTPIKSLNAEAKAFVPRLGDSGKKTPTAKKGPRPLPGPPPPFQHVPPMLPAYFLPPMSPLPIITPPLSDSCRSTGAGGAPPPMPMPMPLPLPPPPTSPLLVNVNVGNASLRALTSKEPRKFACVLVVGMPRVGKTTIGRGLVDALAKDGLSWAFFSGGDYLRDTVSKLPPWATTKEVFDALSKTLDAQLDQQTTPTAVKGIIIDKQCRGTEELFLLTSLLRSKGLMLNGVVGLEADNDAKLMARLSVDDDGFRERCKFHRIIQGRLRDVAKVAGLWHDVDALQSEADVVAAVRSMVLGCSSQAPHKRVTPSMYNDHLTLVEDYAKYAEIMTTLFEQSRATRFTHFPGHTVFAPLTPRELHDRRSRVAETYVARRKGDGTKYVLVYDGASLYFVPRHMRAVFAVPNEAWLGAPLQSLGRFALDGELVRLTKERSREKFLVQDALYWYEKGGTTNLLAAPLGSTWRDRQERLKVNLCSETSAFFSKGVDLVIVHQQHEPPTGAISLLDGPCDYPTDGLVLQPTASRTDPVFWWRLPETVTVDFRLGPVVDACENNEQRTVEVFDTRLNRYSAFREDTVIITRGRAPAVEGAIAICGINPSTIRCEPRQWILHRTRHDVSTASFKAYVDDLLLSLTVSRPDLLAFLGVEPALPPAAVLTPAAAAIAGLSAMMTPAGVVLPPNFVPPPSFFQQQAAVQQAAALHALQTAAALQAVSQCTPQQQIFQFKQMLAAGAAAVQLPSPTVTVGQPSPGPTLCVVGKGTSGQDTAAREHRGPSVGSDDDFRGDADGAERRRRTRGRRGGKNPAGGPAMGIDDGVDDDEDGSLRRSRRGTRGGRRAHRPDGEPDPNGLPGGHVPL